MRDQGTPRFDNDDYSSFSGRFEEQRNFMGIGPRGYTRSDDRIYDDICVALRDDSSLDASDIAVKVEDGIVTLLGKAEGRTEKRIAEMISFDVPGVLDVRNEIVIS